MIGDVLRFVERCAAFAAGWWVLAEGDPSSWLFGVPFAILATLASLRLTPARAWRAAPIGMARYVLFFLFRSFVGGVDVAWRAVRPSMPIEPDLVPYRFRLPPGPARVLLADTVSLLPGTLSTGIEGDVLVLHVLDRRAPVAEEVRVVEERIASALGLELPSRPRDAGGEAV